MAVSLRGAISFKLGGSQSLYKLANLQLVRFLTFLTNAQGSDLTMRKSSVKVAGLEPGELMLELYQSKSSRNAATHPLFEKARFSRMLDKTVTPFLYILPSNWSLWEDIMTKGLVKA